MMKQRQIHGVLLEHDGTPASGYRVAPWEGFDPAHSNIATTDEAGRFEGLSVRGRGCAIAVYDVVPDDSSGSLMARARAAVELASPVNPILICDIPGDVVDIGIISLPRLGTTVVRLQTASGCAVQGSVRWMIRGYRHGSRSYSTDGAGIVHMDRVPLGMTVEMHACIDDNSYGAIEQHFVVTMGATEDAVLRVTGAGTVVVRLHPSGRLEELLVVRQAHAYWAECDDLGHVGGSTTVIRGWTEPGSYPSLTVTGIGVAAKTVENIVVRSDGPTIIDVEMNELTQ